MHYLILSLHTFIPFILIYNCTLKSTHRQDYYYLLLFIPINVCAKWLSYSICIQNIFFQCKPHSYYDITTYLKKQNEMGKEMVKVKIVFVANSTISVVFCTPDVGSARHVLHYVYPITSPSSVHNQKQEHVQFNKTVA